MSGRRGVRENDATLVKWIETMSYPLRPVGIPVAASRGLSRAQPSYSYGARSSTGTRYACTCYVARPAPVFRRDRGLRIWTFRKIPSLMTSQIGSSRLLLQHGDQSCACSGRRAVIAWPTIHPLSADSSSGCDGVHSSGCGPSAPRSGSTTGRASTRPVPSRLFAALGPVQCAASYRG